MQIQNSLRREELATRTIAYFSVAFLQQGQLWGPEYMSRRHLSPAAQYSQSTQAEVLPSTELVDYWLRALERKLCLQNSILGDTLQGLREYARSILSDVVRDLLTENPRMARPLLHYLVG